MTTKSLLSKGRRLFYRQARMEIDNLKFEPVYLFIGEEILLADKLFQLLKEKFLQKAEMELNYFVRYASEGGADTIIPLGTGSGLFSNKKLIVLKEAHLLKDNDIKRLIHFFPNMFSETCIVLQTYQSSIYQTHLKKLEQYVTSVNLLPLKSAELHTFVNNEFKKLDKEVTPAGVQLLIFLVGTQLSDLIGQINLISNNYTSQKIIDTTEIEQVTSIYLSQDIYEFANSLGKKKLDSSIFILNNLLRGGVSSQQIINQLLRHFSILWQIKGYYRNGIQSNSIISKELKIYAKYFDSYVEQSIIWSIESLKKVFGILKSVDKETRDTGIRPEISLDILTIQIINC